jgi:hypothetical protein
MSTYPIVFYFILCLNPEKCSSENIAIGDNSKIETKIMGIEGNLEGVY